MQHLHSRARLGQGPIHHAGLRRRPGRALAGLMLLAALAQTRAATLRVDVTDFMLRPLPARRVALTPLAYPGGGTVVSLEPVSLLTDTNGACAFTNLAAGIYRLDIHGAPLTSFRVALPAAEGLFRAAEVMLAPTNLVNAAGVGYAASASDLRYPSAFGSNLVTWTTNGLRWLAAGLGGAAAATNTALHGSEWSLAGEWRWARANSGWLKWQWWDGETWQDAMSLEEQTAAFQLAPKVTADLLEAPDRLATMSRATNIVAAVMNVGVAAAKARQLDTGTNLNTLMVVQGDSLSNDYDDWATEHITTNGGWLARCYRTNFSSGGQTAATMSNVFNTTIATVAPRTQDEAWLFLWGGINDLAGGASGQTTYGYLTNIWRRAKDAHFKVVAFTVMHATTISAGAQAERTNLNTLILSDPKLYDYLVRADLVLPDASDATYFVDGIHPNALGSSLIAREVVHVLGAETPWTLAAGSSYAASRNLVLKPSGGRVGVNQSNPEYELDVTGSTRVTGDQIVSNEFRLGKFTPGGNSANRMYFIRTDSGNKNEICFDHLDPDSDGVIRWRRDALDFGFVSRGDMNFVIDSTASYTTKLFRWSTDANDYTGTELMRLDENAVLTTSGIKLGGANYAGDGIRLKSGASVLGSLLRVATPAGMMLSSWDAISFNANTTPDSPDTSPELTIDDGNVTIGTNLVMQGTIATPTITGTNNGIFWASNNTLYWTWTAGGTTTNTSKVAGP